MKIQSDYDIKQYKNKQTNQLTKSIKTMKKLLVLALAAFAFAACSEKGEEGTQTLQKGELEHSYLTITLAADDMGTRAEGPVYDEGLPHERKVKSAYVFFFDEDGESFTVTWDSSNSGRNWIELKLPEDLTDKTGSVSDISEQVVIINNYKGEYPDKILAILNWTPEYNTYTLSAIQESIVALGDETNGFVMSNSVYSNENADTDKAVVDAVPLTANNIGKMKPGETTPSNAVEPVILHVERIAAKVRYTANGDTTTGIEGLYDIKAEDVDGNKIYAKVEGFELFNDHEKSYLVKRIDPNWNSTDLGFPWNNPAWFRSYWAKSIDSAFPNNEFAWSHDDIDRSAENSYTYLGENTPSEAKNCTKVIVKATLGKVVSDKFEAVEIANWFGKNYIGEENLLKEVANMLNGLYFYSTDGENFTGIEPEDIMCMQRGGDKKAYEVYYILSDKPNVGKAKKWYKYENGTYNPISAEKLNDELKNVQPALIYKDGMTYYWLDIKHLGKEGKQAEFGVVRNHIYDVNISKISGFGTPIYDPNQDFVVPEKPESVASYVYAQINILSWRVVKNDYEI